MLNKLQIALAFTCAAGMLATAPNGVAQDKKVRLQMASSYSNTLPLLGESGPFVVLQLLVLAVWIALPELVLWLPRQSGLLD